MWGRLTVCGWGLEQDVYQKFLHILQRYKEEGFAIAQVRWGFPERARPRYSWRAAGHAGGNASVAPVPR